MKKSNKILEPMIILTKAGEEILVDAKDYYQLKNKSWYLNQNGYAQASSGSTTVRMHRYIMNLNNGDPKVVDHINGNIRDNRRENLRICTITENNRNSRKPRTKKETSKYKGVSKQGGKWHSQIGVDNNKLYLGSFISEKEAAICYDANAVYHFKEFARINFDKSLYDDMSKYEKYIMGVVPNYISKMTGVNYDNEIKSWKAGLLLNGKDTVTELGIFNSEIDATICYDVNVLEFNINVPTNFEASNYINRNKYKKYMYKMGQIESKYKGVTYSKRKELWKATIKIKQTDIEIGYYATQLEAAQAWNKYVLKNKLGRRLNKI